jgi:hypothetical protein
VETDSHSLKLSWINIHDDENCTVIYVVAWRDITDGGEIGSNITENISFIIDSLEACVTFEVSVSALCVNCCGPESVLINVTTLQVVSDMGFVDP